MLYKNKSVKEVDNYYGINENSSMRDVKLEDCKKIQEAFKEGEIELALLECKTIYEIYSDEYFCSEWEEGIQEMEKTDIFDLLLPLLIKMLNDRVDRLYNISEQLVAGEYVNPVE